MQRYELSAPAWKWLIGALALGIAALLAAEVGAGIRTMRDGRAGTLGLPVAERLGAMTDGLGSHLLRVGDIPADSPLARAGARAADRIRFDRPLDRWRQPEAGDAVGLTLMGSDGARHLVLRAQPVPISAAEQVDYWGRLAVAVPALLFALLLAFRQPLGRACRDLTLTFLMLGADFFYTFTYAPPGVLASFSKLLHLALYPLIFYWYVGFAISYPPPSATRLRRWLLRIAPPFRALMLATSVYAVWFGLGHAAPLLWPCVLLASGGGFLLAMLCLIDGWRITTGEARQRHRWLLLSLCCGSLPPILTTIDALDLSVAGVRVTVLLFFAGQLLMFSLLAYAVMRHRVFDFHFAVSRALVFSVVSILLVCTFGLVEWLVAPLLHGEDVHEARARLPLDAVLAVAVYFMFSRIQGRIERSVEHLFFRAWHRNAQRLRTFVDTSGQAGSTEDLLASLAAALDLFTGRAGAAVYLARRGGDFALALSTREGAVERLDADDMLVVVLRSDLAPVRDGAELARSGADLALPMCHRGALHGFVLLGAKARGDSYRPDEVAVLDYAVRQIGLGLHARRVQALQQSVLDLTERTARQRHAMRELAGRRALPASSRGIAGAQGLRVEAQAPAPAPVRIEALP